MVAHGKEESSGAVMDEDVLYVFRASQGHGSDGAAAVLSDGDRGSVGAHGGEHDLRREQREAMRAARSDESERDSVNDFDITIGNPSAGQRCNKTR